MEKWGLRFGKLVPKVKPKDQIKTWKILKGDIVQVCSGDFEGAQGKVIEVRRRENKVLIEGINLMRRRMNGTTYNVEQGIQVSKVALLDPERKEPTKVNFGFVEKAPGDYKRVRISKASGLEIPKPAPPVRMRKTGEFDTRPEDVFKETFIPSLDQSPIPNDCTL